MNLNLKNNSILKNKKNYISRNKNKELIKKF